MWPNVFFTRNKWRLMIVQANFIRLAYLYWMKCQMPVCINVTGNFIEQSLKTTTHPDMNSRQSERQTSHAIDRLCFKWVSNSEKRFHAFESQCQSQCHCQYEYHCHYRRAQLRALGPLSRAAGVEPSCIRFPPKQATNSTNSTYSSSTYSGTLLG